MKLESDIEAKLWAEMLWVQLDTYEVEEATRRADAGLLAWRARNADLSAKRQAAWDEMTAAIQTIGMKGGDA